MDSVPRISAARRRSRRGRNPCWDSAKAPGVAAFELMAQEAFDRLPEEFRALCSDVLFNVTEFPEDDV